MTLAALLVSAACTVSAYAELNAGDIVNAFNSMNGNAGFYLKLEFQPAGQSFTDIRTYAKLTTTLSRDNVDASAYVGTDRGGMTGQPYFYSFCITPSQRNMPSSGNYIGTLNYENGLTKNRDGVALSVGAAFLYKEFATNSTLGAGNLDWNLFAEAMYFLNNDSSRINLTTTSWSNNDYLQLLLNNYGHIGNASFWMEKYDPGKYYGDWFGEYSVFVMELKNTNGTSGNFQDFLYIAKATQTSPGVPEPATLLLWTLGSMGLYGVSRNRRRRMKKLAVS